MTDINPYQPPEADLIQAGRDNDLLSDLQEQSTWRLVGLTIITLGIYEAHYVKRQTERINRYLADVESQISDELVLGFLVVSYLSVALLAYFLLGSTTPEIETISNLIDRVWMVLAIVWGFKARNRMNKLYALEKGRSERFNGFWTFLFSPYYFNYKVNKLNQQLAAAETDPY